MLFSKARLWTSRAGMPCSVCDCCLAVWYVHLCGQFSESAVSTGGQQRQHSASVNVASTPPRGTPKAQGPSRSPLNASHGGNARSQTQEEEKSSSHSNPNLNSNTSSNSLEEWMPNRKAKGQWLGGPRGSGQRLNGAPRWRRVKGPKDVEALFAKGRSAPGPKRPATMGPKRPFLVSKPQNEQAKNDTEQ